MWPQQQQQQQQQQQRQRQPPPQGPVGLDQYTHRYVGAVDGVETCVSSLGACVVSSPDASVVLSVGAAATTSLVPAFVAGSGATSRTAQLSFTLDFGASSCFFRDCTDLTPLHTPVIVALADPSVGSVVAYSTTILPCPAAPFGFLRGYYTPRSLGIWWVSVTSTTSDLSPLSLWTSLFQTLHLDFWGPSPVHGPRQECYFLIVVDDYSRYTTVLPLQWKADVPTVLEPWLQAGGDA
ncbi:unnamed protein product [Closterium sp. NIES-54]